MKKFLLLILIIIGLAVGGAYFYMNTFFKSDAAAFASKITGTNVAITAVTIDPFNGTVSLRGLDIGNPSGYKSKNAIELGKIYSNIDLKSLLSQKIIINEVSLDGADIYYELKGNVDNIRTLMNNVTKNSSKLSSSSASKSSRPSKDYVIKNLNITNSNLILSAKLFGLDESKTIAVDNISATNVTKANSKAIANKLAKQLTSQIAEALVREKANKYINKYGDKLKSKVNDKINDKLNDAIGGKLKNLF